MNRLSFLVYSLILTSVLNGYAADTLKLSAHRQWHKRAFVALHFAGNIGFISAGVGVTSLRERYYLSILYGYVPEFISKVDVHTVSVRNTFELYRIPTRQILLVPYAGVSLSLEVGGRSFFRQPSNMPERYYRFPKSIHLIPAIGFKAKFGKDINRHLRSCEVFAEAVSVDAYLWYKTISKDISFNEIISFSIGFNLLLR